MSAYAELATFIKTFTDQALPLEGVLELHKRIYLPHASAQLLIARAQEQPISAGLLLGTIKKNFTPSLALLRMIAPHTDKKILLNEKSAWLFVCGRDIFLKSITNGNTEAKLVIVEDEHKQVLGLAKKQKDMYTNVMHAGELLKNK